MIYILKSLKSTGKAAVILPHGVLFRGNAEANIRRELLRRGYVVGPLASREYGLRERIQGLRYCGSEPARQVAGQRARGRSCWS